MFWNAIFCPFFLLCFWIKDINIVFLANQKSMNQATLSPGVDLAPYRLFLGPSRNRWCDGHAWAQAGGEFCGALLMEEIPNNHRLDV